MRIGLITVSFLPNVGGLELKVHHLATEYARRDHQVTVFCSPPRLSRRAAALPFPTSYDVVRCSFPMPGVDRIGLSTALFRRGVLSHHARSPFDVLHCHHLGLPTSFGVAVKKITGTPVVATTCGGDVQVLPEIGYGERLSRRRDRLVRENVRAIEVVGSISHAMRAELERLGTTARIVDIPNGVDWEAFQSPSRSTFRQQLDAGADSRVVLSVGRNQPVKGYPSALAAFARVAGSFPNWIYVLVGRDTDQLAPLVGQLGLRNQVRLIRQVPFSSIPEVFHSADVFFNPSLMEGFSQVNVQAQASRLPCLVTDAPGNIDAGADGSALIARTGDLDSLASSLRLLLGSPDLRERLGAAGHEASKRCAWSRIAGEYLGIFTELRSGYRA